MTEYGLRERSEVASWLRTHAAAAGGRSGTWFLRAQPRFGQFRRPHDYTQRKHARPCRREPGCVTDRSAEQGGGGNVPDLVQAEVAFDILGKVNRISRFSRV